MSEQIATLALQGTPYTALAGFAVRKILSAEIFSHQVGLGAGYPTAPLVAAVCRDRWTDLGGTLCCLPEPVEGLLVLGAGAEWAPSSREQAFCAFLAVGRGGCTEEARSHAARQVKSLWLLVSTTLDYLQLEMIDSVQALRNVYGAADAGRTVEIRRRLERVTIEQGILERRPLGFSGTGDARERVHERGDAPGLEHLFPWVPSDDPWGRLVDALERSAPAALLVHFQGLERAPERCMDQARGAVSRAYDLQHDPRWGKTGAPSGLDRQVADLYDAAVDRLARMNGNVLAMRVFSAGDIAETPGLQAVAVRAIDDASVDPDRKRRLPLFHGGARTGVVGSEEVLVPFAEPDLDILFSPEEAGGVLRTPAPPAHDLGTMRVLRSRTAACTGKSGDDCVLGVNAHRGIRQEIAVESPMRFRHTYVVGQTGTGKSTLLLHMVLHDIRRGRGVAVLDPHGTLIEDILKHTPKERAEDVVIVDPTDIERPVGFNVLRITAHDPTRYRHERDILIDDLYSYIHLTYDLMKVGGPRFEDHFRSMLRLLMGDEAPSPPLVPNLMMLRPAYRSQELRDRLRKRLTQDDAVLQSFFEEAEGVTSSDERLVNLAPYVTSKFNRFLADAALRNMTCQDGILDFGEIIESKRILLFNLGKGRFGEQAAGLLAAQLVSRLRLAAMGRKIDHHTPPFFLYADEFQMFAGERFDELLAEARKFRLGLVLAHQFAGQLPEKTLHAILGNVGTVVALRTGARDAEMLAPLFTPSFLARDLSSLPNFVAYARSAGQLGTEPFSLELAPPPAKGDPKLAEAVRQLSRLKHGRDRCIVEAEINATYRAFLSG